MTQLNLKPTHAPIKTYYETLEKFGRAKFDNEGNIRGAFEDLLKKCARQFEWFLVPEYQLTRTGKHPLRADAALLDAFNLPRAYWEAKDSKDDLRVEMEKKLALGYPAPTSSSNPPPAPSSTESMSQGRGNTPHPSLERN